MDWLAVSIYTTPEGIDPLCGRLYNLGVTGVEIQDKDDFEDFLENNKQYWDYVDDDLLKRMEGVARVKFYVTDDEDGRKQLQQYTAGLEGYEILSASLSENDWATSWQKYYKPLAVGEKIYVVPEWEKDSVLPEGKVPVWLNPGLTFGTGSHASTQLCLEGWKAPFRAATAFWIWAAAAVFCPSPPCVWAPSLPPPWTSTPRRWVWPMKMPP